MHPQRLGDRAERIQNTVFHLSSCRNWFYLDDRARSLPLSPMPPPGVYAPRDSAAYWPDPPWSGFPAGMQNSYSATGSVHSHQSTTG